MATPANATPESVKTTKSGISLETFEPVKLYKKVPIVPAVGSLEEALARVGNDEKKLLAILTEGLQSEAVRSAREDNSNWLLIDDSEKETSEVFAGALANSEDVNPVVLMFAKLNHGFDDIQKGPNSADLKRAAKEAAMADIKDMPKVLEGLRKKAATSKAAD